MNSTLNYLQNELKLSPRCDGNATKRTAAKVARCDGNVFATKRTAAKVARCDGNVFARKELLLKWRGTLPLVGVHTSRRFDSIYML